MTHRQMIDDHARRRASGVVTEEVMAEPTPGPWYIATPRMGFSAITGPNGELIFGLAAGCADEKQPDAVCEANARLIETAPDLRNALIEAEACMSIVEPRSDKAEYLRILGVVRAALAKAEGR